MLLAAVVAVPVFLPENRVSQIGTMGIYGMIGICLVMLTDSVNGKKNEGQAQEHGKQP